MEQKLAALRLARGKQIEVMEANVACLNETETNAYNAAKAETQRLANEIDVQGARMAAVDAEARRGGAYEIRSHHAEVTRDGRDGLVSRMSEALACRYTGKAPSAGAREFTSASVADMARVLCTAVGVSVPGYGAEGAIKLAMASTSDFPALTTETGNRILLAAYQAAAPAIMRCAQRSSAPDFRTKYSLRLSGAPKLLAVPQSGEVTHGPAGESKESYKLGTFARIFGINRQALINDDLGAFAKFASSYGVAAANLEGQEMVDLLYGVSGFGPNMTDGKALIHVDHKNLNGAPELISDDTFSDGRLALRLSKDNDEGQSIIDASPKYLLVPAALETVAERYLALIYPTEARNVNPFSSKMELLVEPRFDAKSSSAWYMVSDPALAPVLEYAHLNDGGPIVETKLGFEYLGLEVRCLLDYGCGAIGWRGIWKGNN